MSICLRRRDFMAGLGGAAVWPVAARTQQGERMRRIGVLIGGPHENDPLAKSELSAFTQALAGLGWTEAATCGWTFVGPALTSIGYERARSSPSGCGGSAC